MKIISTIVIIAISLSVFAQLGSDKPGYTPITAKLLSLNHKVNSNTVKYEKISADNLDLNSQEEFINIYINYEMDVEIPKNNTKGYFTVYDLPEKLMNLDIIYSYHYKIPCKSVAELDSLIPSIDMGKDYEIEKIKASNIYLEKGKLKSKKINKKQIITDTASHNLRISFKDGMLKNNSLIEIIIEFKSQCYNSLNPTFNTSESFKKHLTVSMPFIFDYSYPTDHLAFKLESEEDSPIQLLQLHRENRDWDNVVEIFETNFTKYSWEVASDINSLPNATIKLQGLRLPFDIDIGVPRTELFKID